MSRNPPLRIAHLITQLDVGGAERQLYNLCRLLPPDRYRSQVLSLRRGGALRRRFEDAGCEVREFDRRDCGGAAGQLLALVRHLRREEPDVLQTWLLQANHVGRLAGALAARHPVVASYRDLGFAAGLRDTVLDRLLSPTTALVLHNSESGRRSHLDRTGDRGAARHQLLRNGIDSETYRPDPAARAQMRSKLGLPVGARVTIMVARLHPIKDPRLFLAVGREARRRYPAARFWLVGDGPLGEALRAELAADPDPGLWLAGERQDVPRLLAAADLALLTSRSEGLSNTVLEAMAAGLPVLATDVGGNGELIEDGRSGLLLEGRDPVQIAQRVVQVLQNQDLRGSMGGRGRRRAEELFSLNGLIRRAEDYYHRLVSKG